MLPNSLKKFKLQPPSVPEKRRLVMTSEADTGCGKSSFALRTMPRPLLVIDADDNLEPIMGQYLGDDDIHIYKVLIPDEYEMGNKEHQDRDKRIWGDMMALYLEALSSGYYRSIMFDGGQDIWELCRRATLPNGGMEFGSDKRTDYALANAAMAKLFDAAKASDVNFYMTLSTKPEYKGANATGRTIAAGWKGTIQKSQLHIRLFKDIGEEMPDKFKCEIVKCSARSEAEGWVLTGDEIAFPVLGTKVYPSTEDTPEVWM